MAMGVFEGHMAKMAEGFKAIRMAELELAGEYHPVRHDEFFTYFNWQQFTEEEFHLCPPVVAVGGDGSMYDIGFQNLSRMMMTGKPVKVLLSFTPMQAKYIKTIPIHHSQKVVKDTDKQTVISLELVLNTELKMQILSYGENVRVLKPEHLANEIYETAKKLIVLYE